MSGHSVSHRETAAIPAECDGSSDCKATTHLHGCYSDDGTNCDHPSEHGEPSAAFASDRHPHEPEIPPAWNEDGRCLVCALGVLMDRLLARIEGLRDALEMVATCRREDGTYNFSREACEQIAHDALARDQDFTNQTVTFAADSPITEERPRDVGAPGAAT